MHSMLAPKTAPVTAFGCTVVRSTAQHQSSGGFKATPCITSGRRVAVAAVPTASIATTTAVARSSPSARISFSSRPAGEAGGIRHNSGLRHSSGRGRGAESAPLGFEAALHEPDAKRQHSSLVRRRLQAPVQAAADAPQPSEALFDLLRRERHSLQELSPEVERSILSHLDTIQAAHLGVSCEDVKGINAGSGLGYTEVYSGDDLTLCVFFMRAGACIPLHDHPDMNVIGRLLFGKIRVISFDPEPAAGGQSLKPPGPVGSTWASLRSDRTIGPAPVTYKLGPEEGNVHELQALEDSAFFDILTPPYDPDEGRDCTYYACKESDDGFSPLCTHAHVFSQLFDDPP